MTVTYSDMVTKLSSYSNEKIASLLLDENQNPGWTNTRAMYLLALKQVAEIKGMTHDD